MSDTTVYFARVRPGAVIPTKRSEDAGYDIYACLEEDWIRFEPMETRFVPAGIASACSPDYYWQLQERGSTGTRGIAQRCGVIDSGYRAEWRVPLTNLNRVPLYLARPEARAHFEELAKTEQFKVYYTDKAVSQAILLPVPRAEVVELDYASLEAIPSSRGKGGFGSSNK